MNETSESKSISFNIKSEAGNEVISAEEEIPAYRDVVYSAVIEGQGTYSVEYSTPDGSSGQGDWTTQDCGDSEAPAGNTHAAIIANNDSIEFGANACDAIYFTAGKSNVSKTVTQSD
jgi:hypothetical protein